MTKPTIVKGSPPCKRANGDFWPHQSSSRDLDKVAYSVCVATKEWARNKQNWSIEKSQRSSVLVVVDNKECMASFLTWILQSLEEGCQRWVHVANVVSRSMRHIYHQPAVTFRELLTSTSIIVLLCVSPATCFSSHWSWASQHPCDYDALVTTAVLRTFDQN